MARRLAVVVATVAVVASNVLPAAAVTKTVEIPARRFEPVRVTITVGDTVLWINRDDEDHTVSANTSARAQGETFDSSPGNNCPSLLFDNCLDPGDTFSHTFTTVGTFTYRCKLHGSDTSFANCAMCGQVVVRPRPASPPPSSPSPSVTPTTTSSPTSTASPTGSPTATPTATETSPGPGAPDAGEPTPLPVIPIAAGAVAFLAGTGFFVYRAYLRR